MFIENKYTAWYHKLVDSAKLRGNRKNAKQLLGYVESHHIIPRCMGGDNTVSNIVHLTAREHFVCHLMLTRMVSDIAISHSLSLALWSFRMSASDRKPLTAWEYEYARKKAAAATSVQHTGKEISQETRDKISIARKGRISNRLGATMSEDAKRRISETKKAKAAECASRPMSQVTKEKLSLAHTGKKLTEETKLKMSKSHIGKHTEKQSAEHIAKRVEACRLARLQKSIDKQITDSIISNTEANK